MNRETGREHNGRNRKKEAQWNKGYHRIHNRKKTKEIIVGWTV